MAKSKKKKNKGVEKGFKSNFKADAANTIKPIRTEPSIPKYLYNIDKERYGDQYRTNKKIEKAKAKKKKKKRTA